MEVVGRQMKRCKDEESSECAVMVQAVASEIVFSVRDVDSWRLFYRNRRLSSLTHSIERFDISSAYHYPGRTWPFRPTTSSSSQFCGFYTPVREVHLPAKCTRQQRGHSEFRTQTDRYWCRAVGNCCTKIVLHGRTTG